MSTEEAREACTDLWMREALDAFVCELMLRQRMQRKHEENCATSSLEYFRTEEPQRPQRKLEENRAMCSLEYFRTEEPRKMGQNGEEEVECCLVS